MNKRFDNPQFYNHVFYPTKAWKAIAPFVLGMTVAVGVIFFWNYINPRESLSWEIRTIATVLALALMVPLFIFRLRQLKKIQIGIGASGLYLRGYGLLTWAEINKMEMGQHNHHGKSIKITTYGSTRQGGELTVPAAAHRSLFDVFGESLDEMFIVGSEFISIPLEELFSLLQEYHKEYQQEDDSTVVRPSLCQSQVVHIPARGFSFWGVRLVVATLFILALIAVVLLKGGLEGLWVSIGLGAFAATLFFFNKLHLFFEIIIFFGAFGLFIFGISSFAYELIVHNRLMMKALIGCGIGLFLLILLTMIRRRNKKK